MDFDRLKTVWQSSANAPSVPEAERLKNQFVRDLRRRHRVFIGFSAWVFSALSFCTGSVLYNILITHKVNLEKEWAIILMLAILWMFAIQFLLEFGRHNWNHSHHGESVVNALRATLSENRLACLRARRIGLVSLFSFPALALAIHQLRESEKMNEKEIVSMLVVFGIALAISAGWTAFHYYRKLLPRKTEIEALLRHYDSGED